MIADLVYVELEKHFDIIEKTEWSTGKTFAIIQPETELVIAVEGLEVSFELGSCNYSVDLRSPTSLQELVERLEECAKYLHCANCPFGE